MATDYSINVKGYEQTFTLTSTPTPLFDNPNIAGHYFVRLFANSAPYALIELSVHNDDTGLVSAICFVPQQGPFPISVTGFPPYDFDSITVDFTSQQLNVSVTNDTINTRAIALVFPVGYTGPNSFKCNTFYENTPLNGITFGNRTYFSSGLTATGAISLGDDSSSNNITIGTIGTKNIIIGNNSSNIQLNGIVNIPNSITGTITMSSLPNSSWTGTTGSASISGNHAFISIQSTLNSSGSFQSFTSYDLCSISSITGSFNSANVITSPLLISAGSNSQIGIVTNKLPSTGCNFQFQIPSSLSTMSLSSTPMVFNTSISYMI